MKKLVITLISLIACSIYHSSNIEASDSFTNINVTYNDQNLSLSQNPVIENNTIYVPYSALFEQFGVSTYWDEATISLRGRKSDLDIEFRVGDSFATINGKKQDLGAKTKIINNYTYVPLNTVRLALNKSVELNQDSTLIQIKNLYAKVPTSNPYGNDSFLKLEQVKDHPNVKPNYNEYDGKLYVTWYNTQKINNINFLQFYVSIADKDGNWIKQGERMYSMMLNTGTPKITFVRGSYFVERERSVDQITPTESGGATSKNLVSVPANLQGYSLGKSKYMPVLLNNNRVGLWYYAETTYNNYKSTTNRFYYNKQDGTSTNIEMKDEFRILNELRDNTILYFDESSGIMYILETDGYRQLKVSNGDLIYGSDGKDLITKYTEDPKNKRDGRVIPLSDGFAYLYVDTSTNQWAFSKFTDNFGINPAVKIALDPKDITKDMYINFKNNQIRLWKLYEFNRKPSLEYTALER